MLDSFRGICACLVAVAHFPALSMSNYVPMLNRGDVYVDFFFVLSGFVIFHSYGRRLTNSGQVRDFLTRRFWRLWPLHAAVLAAFLAIEVLQLWLPGGAANPPFSAPGEGGGAILLNFALLHSLHTLPTLSFNWPSWSISVEVWTYVVFAVLIWRLPRHWPAASAIIAFVAAVLLYALRGDLFAMADWGMLRCVYGFACGIGAWHAFQWFSSRGKTPHRAAATIASAAVLAYVNFAAFGAPSMLAPVLFAGVIVIFAFERGAIAHVLSHRWLVEIGARSYSIYMLHILIASKLFFTPAVIADRFGLSLTSEVAGKQVMGTSLLAGTIIEVAFVLVVVVASGFTYRLIEKPGQAFGRHLFSLRERSAEQHHCPASQKRASSETVAGMDPVG